MQLILQSSHPSSLAITLPCDTEITRQEYRSLQSCGGSCKASTVFCPEASLKGHKPAKGLCREFSEGKCRAGGAGSFRFPSHRPEVLPGVNFPLRKVDYKNCLANSSPDILGRMLSPQQPLKEAVCQAAESRDCCTRTA